MAPAPRAAPSLPPGPRLPAPVLTLAYLLRPSEFFDACRRRYGDPFTVRVTPSRTIVFTGDPALVKSVFRGDHHALRAGETNSLFVGPLVGPESVMLSDGDDHTRKRRLMLPRFAGTRVPDFDDAVRRSVERHSAAWPDGTPFPAHRTMRAITLDTLMEAVFARGGAARLERVALTLREAMDDLTSTARILGLGLTISHPGRFTPWHSFRAKVDEARRLISEEIRARRRADETGDDDLLGSYLAARGDDGEPVAEDEIRDAVMTVLVSHETTSTALAWTLERLAHAPAALERIEAERSQGGGEYLEAAIKEAMRMRPVIGGVGRRLAAPFELDGHTLPAGVFVHCSAYLLHHNAEVYPEPLAFRPERFLGNQPGTYTWIPFGGGPRRCLGGAFALGIMRTAMTALLDRFELLPVATPSERIQRTGPSLAPSRGAMIAVARR